MCVTEHELTKRKREHLSEFKKRKEHAHRDGRKKPRKARAPSMTYTCACHTMRTLCGDIASPTCIECKVRGYVTIANGNPNCKTCMCKCDTGVLVFSDIEKMNLKLGWEFRFSVPISGTPIGSGILIPFSIPKIPAGIFFSNSAIEKSRNWNSDSEIWNSEKKLL